MSWRSWLEESPAGSLNINDFLRTVSADVYRGVEGDPGPDGSQGVTGTLGPTGMQGITGSVGPTGMQGVTGSQGITGMQGIPGQNGTTGTQGPTGMQGITGVQGIQGITGSQGITGMRGITGATGTQGITGMTGGIGPTGASGTAGMQGATGPTWPSTLTPTVSTLTLTGSSNQLIFSTGGGSLTVNAIPPISSFKSVSLQGVLLTTSPLQTDIRLGIWKVTTVTSTTTLDSTTCGRIIAISNAGAPYTITLPNGPNGIAGVGGAEYLFVVVGSISGAITIRTNLQSGQKMVRGTVTSATGTAVTGGAITTAVRDVIIGTSAKKGDTYHYRAIWDWYLLGYTGVPTSVTFS